MTLEQKLNAIDALYYTDSAGVVSRIEAPARHHAEQLVQENPRLSLSDLLPCLAVDPPLPIPTI